MSETADRDAGKNWVYPFSLDTRVFTAFSSSASFTSLKVEDMSGYSDFAIETVMYNLQILPETLLCGTIILAVILANQSLAAIAIGVILTQLAAEGIGSFLPGEKLGSSLDMCQSGVMGSSMAKILRGVKSTEKLWRPQAPSVFTATVGFLAGWGYALQQLYSEEIQAGVVSQSTLIGVGIISAVIMILVIVFRVTTGCDTIMAAVGGTILGLLMGYAGCIIIGYATNRKVTNIWGIPLLRDRINNGSALYYCPSG